MATYHSVLSLLSFPLVLAIGSCSSSGPAPKEPEKCKVQALTGAIIASPHINPTIEGDPRPVQLRLYQLKSDTSFLNASFEQVWQDDKTALGDSLVKVEELSVYPNTRVAFKFERNDAAQFLTAAALFREPKGRTWFASFELPPPPSAGSCGAKSKEGEADAGTKPDYRIYIWLDGTTVQDGADHADEFPEGRVINADGTTSVIGSECADAADAAKNSLTDAAGAAKDSATDAAGAQMPDSVKPPDVKPPTMPTK
jgi:type VI secretion system protein VasD